MEYSIDGGTTWQATGEFMDLEEGEYDVVVRIENSECEGVFSNNPVDVSPLAGLRITMPPGDQLICKEADKTCLLYTSPSPRDATLSRMPSSA